MPHDLRCTRWLWQWCRCLAAALPLLGGTGRLWGPIVGVIPFALLQEFINANYSNYSTLVLGLAFLVIVYFLPHGVVGRIEQAVAKRRRATW